MTLPIKIKQWLNNRGITDEVIENNNIEWNGSQIVIPVFHPDYYFGKFLFNKYRRDPFGPKDVPKYKYDKGATAQLYNAHKIRPSTNTIIITESELDALCLESHGYMAVSSTGGAGVFKDEWLPFLTGKEVYICYDNDDAGIKGAVKLLTKLPTKLVMIPREKGIKDITEYLIYYTSPAMLLKEAEKFPILAEPVPELKKIKDVKRQIKIYNNLLDELLYKEREAKNTGKAFIHYDYIRQLLLNAIGNLRREIRKIRYFKKPVEVKNEDNKITDEDIARAKKVPIEKLYSGQLRIFGNKAVGICPFHNEVYPSFTIYLDENKFYCYGCSAGTDAIDFIMKRDDCDFVTAVKKLINKSW
jgi:hypothetical protein